MCSQQMEICRIIVKISFSKNRGNAADFPTNTYTYLQRENWFE